MKLLIADDEDLVVDGISFLVEEAGLDWDVRTARNGEEAHRIAGTWEPDILITDIRMPICDGLELCRRLKYDGLSPVTLIVSGYEDFSYARTAIEYGVQSYLLKPINQEDMIDRLKKLDTEMRTERRRTREAGRHLRYALRKILVDLARGEISSAGAMRAFGPWLESYDGNKATVAVVLVEGLHGWATNPQTVASDAMGTLLAAVESQWQADSAIATENSLDEMIILVAGEDSAATRSKIGRILDRKLGGYLHYSYAVSASTLGDLHATYVDCFSRAFIQSASPHARLDRALNRGAEETAPAIGRPFVAPASLPGWVRPSCPKGLAPDYIALRGTVKPFLAAVQGGEIAAVHEATEAMIRSLAGEDVEVAEQRYSLWLALVGARYAAGGSNPAPGAEGPGPGRDPRNEASGSQPAAAQSRGFGSDPLLEGTSHLAGEEMRTAVRDAMDELFSVDRGGVLVRAAMTLIRSDLKQATLRSVADQLGISPVYLSTVFKTKTGRKFKDFLAEARVRHARERLKDPRSRVAEIADELGYSEPKHFASMFKRRTGMTPSQFRGSIPTTDPKFSA